MMIKKLSKHGNSLALVIDKPILELLGIDEETELEFTRREDGLFFRKKPDNGLPADFDARKDRLNERWGPVFKKLAE